MDGIPSMTVRKNKKNKYVDTLIGVYANSKHLTGRQNPLSKVETEMGNIFHSCKLRKLAQHFAL